MPSYTGGTIYIPNVTGNIVITATATAATVTSISAVFNQGQNVIYDTDSLDTLKQYLTVTATYTGGATAVVTGYTLSGTLTAGTSTISVSYSGKSATFNVTVTVASALHPLKNGTYYYGDKQNSVTISGGKHVKFEFIQAQTFNGFVNLSNGNYGQTAAVINNLPLLFTIPASQNVVFTVENVVNTSGALFEMNFRKALTSSSGSFGTGSGSHTEGITISKTLSTAEDISCLFIYFSSVSFPAGSVLEFDVGLTVGNDDYIPGTYPLWTGATVLGGQTQTKLEISDGNHVSIVYGAQQASLFNLTTGEMFYNVGSNLDNLPLWFSIPSNTQTNFVIENVINNEGPGTGISFALNFKQALSTKSLSFGTGSGGHFDGVDITQTLNTQEDASCLFIYADSGIGTGKTLEFDVGFTVGNIKYI